jgi:molecular chaperone DnaK (HSP70)
MGAALEAGIVMGIVGNEFKNLLQIDAISQSLGIETEDGRMNILIERNSPFPLVKTMVFTTSEDN